MRSSGHCVAASQSASAGFGWVSRKTPATPAATAALANSGTCRRSPPVTLPRLPGCCAECVASKTTGAPVSLLPYGYIARRGEPEGMNFFILHEGAVGWSDGPDLV